MTTSNRERDRRTFGPLRAAVAMPGVFVVGAGAVLTGVPALSAPSPAPVVRTADVQLSGILFGDGTQENPNAGLFFGTA